MGSLRPGGSKDRGRDRALTLFPSSFSVCRQGKERTDVVIFLAETRTLNNRSHSHFYVVYYWYHRSNTDDENSQTESNRLEEWVGMIMFEIMIYTFRLRSMAMFNVKRCMEF